MTIDQTKIISGPCKITVGAAAMYSVGDVEIVPEIEARAVDSSVLGKHDEVVQSNVLRIRFKPKQLWSYNTILWPASIISETYAGARVFSGTAQAVVVVGSNGDQWTFHDCRLTKMPEMFIGIGEDLWGECEFTAIYLHNTATTAAAAMFTFAASQAFSVSDFPSGHTEVDASAVWTGKTGFTAIVPQDGFRITPELELRPITVQKQIANYSLKSFNALAKCKPVGPTASNMLTAALLQDTGGGPGRRLSTSGADLVITGTGVSCTLKGAALKTAGYAFGTEVLRHGEVGWVTTATSNIAKVVLA